MAKAVWRGTVCPWKGTATCWSLEVDGEVNPDALRTYREPRQAAAQIRERLAFWSGVEVTAQDA